MQGKTVMADMIKMQIQNAQLVQNALNAFAKKISQKVVKQGVRAAWTPLLKKARTNAKANIGGKEGGKIAKALKLRVFKKQKKGNYGMHVSMSYYQGDVYYVTGAHSKLKWSSNIETKKTSYKPGREEGRYYIPVALEYGHAKPGRGRWSGGGKHPPKDVAAQPFLRPALDATLPNAPKIFERHLVHAIHEENAKRR